MFPWTTFLRLLQHTDGLESGRPFLILPLLFLVLDCEPFTKEDDEDDEDAEAEDERGVIRDADDDDDDDDDCGGEEEEEEEEIEGLQGSWTDLVICESCLQDNIFFQAIHGVGILASLPFLLCIYLLCFFSVLLFT